MRVNYQKNDKTWSYLHYNQFSVESANEEYPLTVGGFTGVGNNLFNYRLDRHTGMKFTTLDYDNDEGSDRNCVGAYKSGWCYHSCPYININQLPPYVHGVALSSEMKIHPKDCIIQ